MITKKTQHILKAILMVNTLFTSQCSFAGPCFSGDSTHDHENIFPNRRKTPIYHEIGGESDLF